MKPRFSQVPTTQDYSFNIRRDVGSAFRGLWHFHPELELHYVIKGSGIRMVYDDVANFSSGELVLLGEKLPHCWRSYDADTAEKAAGIEVIVLNFLPNCLGHSLLNLPEAYMLPKLFEKAKSGMIILGEARKTIVGLMRKLTKAIGLDRLITFVTILKTLAETDEYQEITFGKDNIYQFNEIDSKRFNSIYNYTLSNFKEDVSLKEVASLGHLSITSFCRYFKLATNQRYKSFITHIRLSHARKLLIEDKLSITAICFESGFHNKANFYRHFKKFTGLTPMEYRIKYVRNNQPDAHPPPKMRSKFV